MKILNFLSLSGLFLLPLAYIFSLASINIILFIIVFNFLLSSFIFKDYGGFKNNFFKSVLIFWFYISLQGALSENGNLLKSIGYIRFLILPFAISYLLNKNLDKINLLKSFYLIIVALVIFDIFIQVFTGKDLLGYRADWINGFYSTPFELWNTHALQRFAGPFGFDKRAGAFILFFGIIGYFLNNNLNNNNNKKNFYLFLFFSILTITIVLTGDRSPLLILFITFALFAFLEKKHRKKALLIFSSSMVIFSLLFMFSENTKYRFYKNIKEYGHNSGSNYIPSIDPGMNTNKRISHIIRNNPWAAHYLAAIEIFKDAPIFGKGIRSFRIECDKHPNINTKYSKTRCSTHPHNSLLEIISELGIVGLLLFGMMFFFLTKSKNSESYSNNLIFYLFIATILPIKPTGAIFSTWFGSILWLLVAFYYWEKNKFTNHKV